MKPLIAVALCAVALQAAAIDFSNRYRSPRNPERRVRASTELIVLHTTEAPSRSSLNKLSDRGEAHYCVTEEGTVYRIVDRDRMAFHAGRSMWRGKEDVDNFSIGIECVGYHDKPMGAVQLAAIRDLVAKLKEMYRLSDDKVVCHSHVAYGMPNKWQKRRHRGRKRCGMLFAMPSVRKVLGLKARPAVDADTKAGRLAIGDDYLNKVLYGKTDTMVGRVSVIGGEKPAKTESGGFFTGIGKFFGKSDSKAKPAPAPAAKPTATAKTPPKAPAPKPSTPKVQVSGKKPTISPAKPPAPASKPAIPKSIDDLKKQGYVLKGTVSKGVTASKLAGGKWNAADTYYTIRNKVIPGNKIDAAHIEKDMGVWMKK